MLIGYARVSTEDQKLELQLDALREIRCEKVFTDVASGAYTERFGLTEVLSYLKWLSINVQVVIIILTTIKFLKYSLIISI